MKCASPTVFESNGKLSSDTNFAQETFTAIPVLSERFASSSAFQYHQLLPSLANFFTYVTRKICASQASPCLTRAAAIPFADFVDIDFDSISQALVMKAFRHRPADVATWNEHIQSIGGHRVEVGVLANEKATEPESVSMGGFLTVLGEDEIPCEYTSKVGR